MATSPIVAAVELVLDCANGQEARRLSTYLLERRLIARSSILPKNHASRWQSGDVHEAPVTLMMVTRTENVAFIAEEINGVLGKKAKIKAIPVEQPSDATLEWVDNAIPREGN